MVDISIPSGSQRGAGSGASVLDRNLSITGTITSHGAVRIEGTVDGDVEAHSVTLAEGATVNGSVNADLAVIQGRLIGPLHAREARLTETAHVEGEIEHTILVVEAGAHFDGQCRRAATAAAAPQAPAVTEKAKTDAAKPAESDAALL